MRHAPVFAIAARNSYYTDGTCPDVEFHASGETAKILRGHRWLARAGAGRLTVLAQMNEAGRPLIELDPGARLQFRLVVTGGQFPLFTELDGITPATLFVPGAGDAGPVRILRPSATKNAVWEAGTLAGVEIPGSLLQVAGGDPLEFQVQFEARRTRWKYYCVTDIKLNGKELLIVDRDGSTGALRFSTANRRDLSLEPDPRDAVAARLAEQFPRQTKIRFLSDDLVPCREVPRRKLELLLGSNRFPEPLPNPPLNNHSSVDVADGGMSSQQPALYQIVTYLTQPLSEKGD